MSLPTAHNNEAHRPAVGSNQRLRFHQTSLVETALKTVCPAGARVQGDRVTGSDPAGSDVVNSQDHAVYRCTHYGSRDVISGHVVPRILLWCALA